LLGIQRLGVGSSLKSIKEEKIMKNLLSNLIDFFGKRINAPPIYKNLKIFLLSHEKIYNGVYLFYCKKINLKNLKVMKKAVLFLFLFVSSYFSAFSQTARINEYACSSPSTSCKINVCKNQNIDLTAYLDGGNIESVVWTEQIMSTLSGPVYSSSQVGGGDLTISAPFSTLPVGNYYYRYWLVVYMQGGGIRQAFLDIHLVDLPTAMLSASSSTICAGEEVTFLASGGAIYEFKVNGVREQIGETNLFSSSLLNNNDTVVVVVSENGCSTTSEPISMTVHEIPDLGSVTPSPTCYGDDMEFTYSGLTGSGFWTLSFWNTEHNVQYGDDYSVTSSGGLLTVPIEYGTNEVHLKIIDTATGCSNF